MPTTSLIDNDKPNEPDTDDDDADGGKDETRSAWPVAYEWGVSQEAQLEEAIAEAERQGGADPAHVLLADRLLPSPVRQAIQDWMKRAKEFAVRANKRPFPPNDGTIPTQQATQARACGCTTADGARMPANLPVIGVAELEALVDQKEAVKQAWLRRVDEQLPALHVEPPHSPHNNESFPVIFTGKGSCLTTDEHEALLKCFIKPREWCKPKRDVRCARQTAHTLPTLGTALFSPRCVHRVCYRFALSQAGFAEARVIGVRLGEPGDAGELVAIWLRSVLSVRALMGRRAGPQAHHLRSWRGWMKVCGASGLLRLREVLRHIKNYAAIWGWGSRQMSPADIHRIEVRGSSARMFYRGGEKGFQLGNLLWRHPSKVAEIGKDCLARVYVEEVQALMQLYGPLMVPGRQRGWLVGPEEVAFVDWHLERLMTNEMSEHESHLAIHVDRPTVLPAALTGGNARLDGESPFRRGSLLYVDGAFEIPYGERDCLLLWTDYAHAVIPPTGAHGAVEPRRLSVLHYTRRGREGSPACEHVENDKLVNEARRRVLLFGEAQSGARTRSSRK